jgi:hypothetical protein
MTDGGTAAESGRLGMLIRNRPIPVSFPRPALTGGAFPVSRLGRKRPADLGQNFAGSNGPLETLAAADAVTRCLLGSAGR